MTVTILSLFDGMACGMLAMQKANVPVSRYVAYEIDKYAIKTSLHNFPMIEHRGDVFKADFTEYAGFDFLVGGSPCTYWSIAQKNNRETEASGMGWELFSQYVRALREAKPKYFVYENNKSMSKAIRESISNTFGFEPICINSALVSAQNRQRLYWCGIRQADGTYKKADIPQPEDRGILLKDILEGTTDREKSRCDTASVGRTTTREYFKKSQNTVAYEPVVPFVESKFDKAVEKYGYIPEMYNPYNNAEITDKAPTQTAQCGSQTTSATVMICEPVCVAERGRYNADGIIEQHFEVREYGKTNVLTTVQKDNNVAVPVNITDNGKSYCIRATCYKDGVRNIVGNNIDKRTGVAEPIRVGALPRPNGELSTSQAFRVYSTEGKSVNINAGGGGAVGKTGLYAIPVKFENGIPTKAISYADGKTYDVYTVKDGFITIKCKQYPIKLADGFYIIRKLTVRECMRLQTVPEWYEFPVSDTQAYKMLGNGWTVDVIAHILKHIKENN